MEPYKVTYEFYAIAESREAAVAAAIQHMIQAKHWHFKVARFDAESGIAAENPKYEEDEE